MDSSHWNPEQVRRRLPTHRVSMQTPQDPRPARGCQERVQTLPWLKTFNIFLVAKIATLETSLYFFLPQNMLNKTLYTLSWSVLIPNKITGFPYTFLSIGNHQHQFSENQCSSLVDIHAPTPLHTTQRLLSHRAQFSLQNTIHSPAPADPGYGGKQKRSVLCKSA